MILMKLEEERMNHMGQRRRRNNNNNNSPIICHSNHLMLIIQGRRTGNRMLRRKITAVLSIKISLNNIGHHRESQADGAWPATGSAA